jgi:hypothetical protein
MASNAFKRALAATGASKNVETMLIGGNYLPEGDHDVLIKAVDSKDIENGRVTVTYEDKDGRTYTDRLFLMDQNGEGFSPNVRQLWSAVIPDKAALAKFIEIASEDDKAFEMFTGFKLRIQLKPGKGVQARSVDTPEGKKFAGYDVESGDKVTENYDEIKEVYEEVKARDLKRSYLRNYRSTATHAEENVAAFFAAADAKSNKPQFSAAPKAI